MRKRYAIVLRSRVRGRGVLRRDRSREPNCESVEEGDRVFFHALQTIEAARRCLLKIFCSPMVRWTKRSGHSTLAGYRRRLPSVDARGRSVTRVGAGDGRWSLFGKAAIARGGGVRRKRASPWELAYLRALSMARYLRWLSKNLDPMASGKIACSAHSHLTGETAIRSIR